MGAWALRLHANTAETDLSATQSNMGAWALRFAANTAKRRPYCRAVKHGRMGPSLPRDTARALQNLLQHNQTWARGPFASPRAQRKPTYPSSPSLPATQRKPTYCRAVRRGRMGPFALPRHSANRPAAQSNMGAWASGSLLQRTQQLYQRRPTISCDLKALCPTTRRRAWAVAATTRRPNPLDG
jgi:hypothetical protein